MPKNNWDSSYSFKTCWKTLKAWRSYMYQMEKGAGGTQINLIKKKNPSYQKKNSFWRGKNLLVIFYFANNYNSIALLMEILVKCWVIF